MGLIVNIIPIVDPGVPDNDGTVDTLPSAYQETFFDTNVDFSYIDDFTSLNVPITNVVCNIPYPGVNFSTVSVSPTNYVVKVSGNITSSVFSETFRFYMGNATLQYLEPNTTENWVSIVEWNPPETTILSNAYIFTSTVSGVGNVVHNITQYLYWNLEPSLNTFTTFVNTGV